MAEKLTVFILSTKGSTRRATISKNFIYFLIFLMIGGAGAIGVAMKDYIRVKKALPVAEALQSKISTQDIEIMTQRRQIQSFTEEINDLKSEILALNAFEQRIRTLIAADSSDEENSLFGVGGAFPEDLAPETDLAEKHASLIREMHDQMDQLEYAAVNQKGGFEALLQSIDEHKNFLAATPSIRPIKGLLTSKFGRRTSPFTGLREFHKGVDLAAPVGTPIKAAADGVVTFAGAKGFWGKMVIINHGHGMVTQYAHVHKFMKKTGESVKRGDVIALVGNTGRSTGPHVHYEVHLNGAPVNPLDYILN